MANRFLNNITINDSYTFPNADGTANQIIKTDGSGQLSFIDQSDVIAGEADKAKSVTIRVKNSTGSAMSKGQVICEAVSASPPSGNLIEVALADNNGTNTMPALGILNEDLDASGGANDEGDAIMFGKVSGIDTSAFSVGDEVFVDDTAGGLTTTKPTGVKYIQKVGVVIRDDASNGTIEVFGAGRVNDVPTPLYIDHANQRLGIGAPSPDAKLEVSSSDASTYMHLNNDSTGNTRFKMSNDSDANANGFQIINNASDGQVNLLNYKNSDLALWTSSSQRMTIESGGNVGIGTNDPAAKLEVEGGDHLFQLSTTSSTGNPYLSFNQAGARRSFIQHADSGDYLKLASEYGGISFFTGTGGTETQKMTILSGGNVGINTTNPNQKLTIRGNDYYVATEQTSYAWGAANTIGLRMGTSSAGVLDFRRWDGSVTHGTAAITQVSSDGGWGLDFRVDNKSTNTSATTSRMFLSTSGEVGIGTTSPSAKLTVVDDILLTGSSPSLTLTDATSSFVVTTNTAGEGIIKTSGDKNIRFFRNGSTETMRIAAVTGNVGIGTTSPSSKLHVRKAAGPLSSFNSNTIGIYENSGPGYVNIVTGATSTGELWFSDSSEGRGRVRYNHSDDSLQFWTANGEKLRVGVSGQIGIGGTNYGSSGQVLTSNGANSAPSWQAAGGGGGSYTPNIVSGATTASKDNLYIFTASATLTLPANPSGGDSIKVSNLSGTTTCVIARNTKNIMAVGEDMTLDNQYASFELIYSDATRGWVIIGATGELN